MTTIASPIELPTHRQSRFVDPDAANVHDSNYIPLLNGASNMRLDVTVSSFSAIPSIPQPPKEKSTSLTRSNSASAPETVIVSKGRPDLSEERPQVSRYVTAQEIGSSQHIPRRNKSKSNGSSDAGTVVSDPSSGSTTAALEEQVFMIPGNSVPKPQEAFKPRPEESFRPAMHSSRSSVSSNKKLMTPTSKYNKGTISAMPSVPSLHSAMMNSAQPAEDTTSRAAAASTHRDHIRPADISPSITPPPIPVDTATTVRMLHMKSTASERRARALHSHPSNISMKSSKASIPDDEEAPLVPNIDARPDTRPGSSRSRSHSIVNLQQPSPAPTTPLPELPPQAKVRPPTRERSVGRSTHSIPSTPTFAPGQNVSTMPSPALSQRPNEHIEMANFMNTKKTVVFRRFDDVHVRMLLHLQDEIQQLEAEILELESPTQNSPDKYVKKSAAMKQLRKSLAEYDHLFANWSHMHVNKASPAVREQLSKWLQSPDSEIAMISKRATEDLAWLEKTKDLTAVSIDPEKALPSAQTSEKTGPDSTNDAAGPSFWASLFGCASKRK